MGRSNTSVQGEGGAGDLFVGVGGALVLDVDLDRVDARGCRAVPDKGVGRAVGLDNGPTPARGLDPELVGRSPGAGRDGGEGNGRAVGLGTGLVGVEADRAAPDQLVGQVLDRVVAHRFGLVSDVDLDVVAAGAPG